MREGTDLSLFASSISLKRYTEKLGVNEEQIESLLVNVEEHCFKKRIETKEFIKIANDAGCNMSNRMQVSVEDLPHQLQQMVNESNLLAEEIERKKADKARALTDYNITQRQLEEFSNNAPLIEKSQLTERQLAAESKMKIPRQYRLMSFLNWPIISIVSPADMSIS